MNVGLVACGKSKTDSACPARRLYTGDLFLKASRYCEAQYDRWYVLSALHGLVAPDTILAPYDATLIGQPKSERIAWADRVEEQVRSLELPKAVFWFHAGRAYSENLGRRLDSRFPVAGLGIGQQLRWYKEKGF